MKKILLSVVCLVVVGIQSVQAQVAIAALHHNNAVTIYSAAQIQVAVDAAEPGDTIYLSEGIFGGFTVAKRIAMIGAGQTTQISSDVTIGQSDTSVEAGFLLSGVNLLQDLNFRYIVNGARIMQCVIDGNCSFFYSNQYSFSNIEILMSYIKGYLDFGSSSKIQSITVIGSKINEIRNGSAGEGGSTFLNCNIKDTGAYTNGKNNNFVNCIIDDIGSGVLSNCLYRANNNGIIHNCYKENFTMPSNLDSPYTDEELRSKNYLGTDNTVVGITGGEAPFSLVMPIVQITEHSLQVDQTERKLQVTLKLGNK